MSGQDRCFVIQPFDGGEYDKRYDDVFVPAIEASGLEAYRVDRDPKAHVPIESIEREIRNSVAVLADISLDRPNIWYEVGYAFANSHPVVLVCRSDARDRGFPFDVQHRNVTSYSVESPRDFDEFRVTLIERLKAVVSEERISRRLSQDPVAAHQGLRPHEIVALAMTAQHQLVVGNGVSEWEVRRAVTNAGFNELGLALAIKRLTELRFMATTTAEDERGETYTHLRVREAGFGWLEENQDSLNLRAGSADRSPDEIPF